LKSIYSPAGKKSMGVVGSMMLGALLGGGLIDSLNAAAPLVASTALLAIAVIYVGAIMHASRSVAQSWFLAEYGAPSLLRQGPADGH
jgi:hypothetical protein